MKIIRQIISYLKKLFWTKPVSRPKPFTATEVKHLYTCIKYNGQWINLRKNEIAAWENLARSDKRAMALKFKMQVKKGHLKFTEIDGEMICVKNKNYGSIDSRSKQA